jgi:AcrR family transcriptional regulator
MTLTNRSVPRILAEQPTLPPEAIRDGTAGRLLSAALTLFAQKGYDGTSIRDIAEAIGMLPGNLYDHFASKEHLLAELVLLGHSEHYRLLRIAVVNADGPAAQLQAMVRAHVRLHAQYAMLGTVATSEMHALSPELAAPALALRQQSEELLKDVIQRGMAAGLFAPPNPWLAAAAIGGMGIRVSYWYRSDFPLTIDQIADDYAELALRMMTPRRR